MRSLFRALAAFFVTWQFRRLESKRQKLLQREQALLEAVRNLGATKEGRALLKSRENAKEYGKCITPGLTLSHEYRMVLKRADAVGKQLGIRDMRERIVAFALHASDKAPLPPGTRVSREMYRELKAISQSLTKINILGKKALKCNRELARRIMKQEIDKTGGWNIMCASMLFIWRRISRQDPIMAAVNLFTAYDGALKGYDARTSQLLREYKAKREGMHRGCLRKIERLEKRATLMARRYPEIFKMLFPDSADEKEATVWVFPDKPARQTQAVRIRPMRCKPKKEDKHAAIAECEPERWLYEYAPRGTQAALSFSEEEFDKDREEALRQLLVAEGFAQPAALQVIARLRVIRGMPMLKLRKWKQVSHTEPAGWKIFRTGCHIRILADIAEYDGQVKFRFMVVKRRDAYRR